MNNSRILFLGAAGIAACFAQGAQAQEVGLCGQPAALTQGGFTMSGRDAMPFDAVLDIVRGEPAYIEFALEGESGITIETFTNDLDPLVILFDEFGQMVRSDDDGSGNLNPRLGANLAPGNYCAQISSLADIPPVTGTLPQGYNGPVPIRVSTGISAGAGGCSSQLGLVTLETPLSPGAGAQSLDGMLPNGGAVAFTLAEPMALSITARSNDFDTLLSLEDGFGGQLGTDDDGGGGTNSYLGLSSPLDAGDYCVQVTSYDGGNGGFSLTFDDWSEATDAQASGGGLIADPCGDPAATTDLGEALSTGFAAHRYAQTLSNAPRFFSFETAEPLELRLTATSDGIDTVLGLYDADGLEIDNNDDAEGLGTNSRIQTGGALPAGSYCAAVSPYSGDGSGTIQFDLIEMTEEALLQEAYDTGDILPPDAAVEYTQLGLLERNLRSDNVTGAGTRWYKFEVDEESLVVVDATGLGDLSKLVLFDYEGTGLKIAESGIDPEAISARLVRKIGSGVYALGVVRTGGGGGLEASVVSLQRYVRPPRSQ